MANFSCNICKREGKEFKVPAGDHIGTALMKQHLKQEHGVADRELPVIEYYEAGF